MTLEDLAAEFGVSRERAADRGPRLRRCGGGEATVARAEQATLERRTNA